MSDQSLQLLLLLWQAGSASAAENDYEPVLDASALTSCDEVNSLLLQILRAGFHPAAIRRPAADASRSLTFRAIFGLRKFRVIYGTTTGGARALPDVPLSG